MKTYQMKAIAEAAARINAIAIGLNGTVASKRQIAIIAAVLTSGDDDTERLKALRSAAFTVRDSIQADLPFEPD